MKWNSTENSCELLWRDVRSKAYQVLIFKAYSPYTTDVTFWKKISKNSQKISKKLPKTGSSKHPWLTANPITWTSFFGNLKNPTIFKFQNMGAPEHVSTPLVSKLKITFFPDEERTDGNLVLTVRTDVKSASRNYHQVSP